MTPFEPGQTEHPDRQTFQLTDLSALRAEIEMRQLDIPLSEDLSVLATPLHAGGKTIINRFCAQPVEGCDATPDGSPGPLTYRRYARSAQGGFGLIWVEATAVIEQARSGHSQLCLHEGNVAQFKDFVDAIRQRAKEALEKDIVLVLQLAHAGRYCSPSPLLVHHNPVLDRRYQIPKNYPLLSDGDLDQLQKAYVKAAGLAVDAGFDGVDIKSCHQDLIAELLAAVTRKGRYGGSFENRTRFLRETVAAVHAENPDLLMATRLSVFDGIPHPYGFGVDEKDPRRPDLAEPIKLARLLQEDGISLLNVSLGGPAPKPTERKLFDAPVPGMISPNEPPMRAVYRFIDLTRSMQKAAPDLPVVSSGTSWLHQFVPQVGAALIQDNAVAMIGLGRGALAYPNTPRDVLQNGSMDPDQCCIACSACVQLIREHAATGCVIHDREVYGNIYQHERRFAPDELRNEAERCHQCSPAPCVTACPARLNVPAFIGAYAKGDIPAAYEAMRATNVLPEVCAHLCPLWLMCQGACVEGTMTGQPIRIADLQYTVSWLAREQGLTGIRVPETRSGKTIAVVGGGPAGLAAAVSLIEKGHQVALFEREQELGGTPNRLIPATRLMDVQPEISGVLGPALKTQRLDVRYGNILGKDIKLNDLSQEHDAVLLAAGLGAELSLGAPCQGVIDALSFLAETKRGERTSVPKRVAILAGGDSAMDVATFASQNGADDLYIVYAGALSEMHWHKESDWFQTSGAHALTLTHPLGYETDGSGQLTGLKVCRTQLVEPDENGARLPTAVPDTESILAVDMVVEAMGLCMAKDLQNELKNITLTGHGLIETMKDGSYRTNLDKVFAAGALINGGAAVSQCVAEGMAAAKEISEMLA